MKRSPVIVAAIGVVMVLGATVYVRRHRTEQPGSSKLEVTRKGRATEPGSYSDNRSWHQVPLFFEDPMRALSEMYASQEEGSSNAFAQVPLEDTLAKSPVEPSIFNVDVVAVGPHAYEITADRDMVDQQEDVGLTNSDSMNQPTGATVNAVSSDVAHNEQILQGKATAEDQSIGPKEVDPDSHPPTD